jgi:hypothetical protein
MQNNLLKIKPEVPPFGSKHRLTLFLGFRADSAACLIYFEMSNVACQ